MIFKKKDANQASETVVSAENCPKKRKGLKALVATLMTMIASAIPSFAAETGATAGDVGLEGGIETISTFFTALFQWIADAAQVIVTNWVLVLFVIAMPIAGWLFSLLFRLLGRGRGKK